MVELLTYNKSSAQTGWLLRMILTLDKTAITDSQWDFMKSLIDKIDDDNRVLELAMQQFGIKTGSIYCLKSLLNKRTASSFIETLKEELNYE